jgi:DNA-binding NtrC family response regulator
MKELLGKVMAWIRGETETIHVLAVMPDAKDRAALAKIAQQEKWDARFALHMQAAVEILRRVEAPVIICDREFTPDWREAIRFFGSHSPRSRVILTSPGTDDRLWLEVIEHGGYDVLTRPLHEGRVVQAVRLAWGRAAH